MVQAKAIAPQVIMYQADEDLSAGHVVGLSGMTTVNNPVPNTSLTTPCPKVAKVAASATSSDFLGVVLYDASDGDWVHVVVEGIVEAQFDAGHDINAGNPLIISDTAGKLADLAASSLTKTENICCFAAEDGADDSTAESEKINIYIPPRPITCGGDLI